MTDQNEVTAEMKVLLRRAQAAGAPLRLGKSPTPGQDVAHLSGLLHAGVVTVYLSGWEPLDTAALVHVLRHDAFQRGISRYGVTDFRFLDAGFVVILQSGVGYGQHENEACAWLLAWLDAFEEAAE